MHTNEDETETEVEECVRVVGNEILFYGTIDRDNACLLYTSPSPRDLSTSRMPSSA